MTAFKHRASEGMSDGQIAIVRVQPPWLLRADSRFLFPLIALLLLPNLIWIFEEQGVWPWDNASYAETALRICHEGANGLLSWFRALFLVPESRAPLLPWMAQIFVPFM